VEASVSEFRKCLSIKNQYTIGTYFLCKTFEGFYELKLDNEKKSSTTDGGFRAQLA